MDQKAEQEQNNPQLEHYAHVSIDDEFEPTKAAYDVLRKFGFKIEFQSAVDSEGRLIEGRGEVLIDPTQKAKIDLIMQLLNESPEKILFSNVANGYLHIPWFLPPEEWIQKNRRLFNRAQKASHIRQAELLERDPEMKFVSASIPDLTALQYRELAEVIPDRPLDGEGVRIVLHRKVNSILEAHPELKP